MRHWAQSLPFAAGLSIAHVVQGYTGRWQLFAKYSKWRGLDLKESAGDRVELSGYLDLWLPQAGVGGHGVVHGQLTAELKTMDCLAEFRLTSLMNNMTCSRDGELTFETEVFSRQRIRFEGQHSVHADGLEEEIIGYPRHSWSLHPAPSKEGVLVGGFRLPDRRSAAIVETTKIRS